MTISNHNYIEGKLTQNKFKTAIETLVNAKNLFTVDESLKEQDGDVKVVNVTTFTGNIVNGDTNEAVADADRGKLNYTQKEYRVTAKKAAYDISDKQKRQNSNIITDAAQGQAETVWNHINDEFYKALATITKTSEYTTLNWDSVEDALAELNLEDRTGMFLLVNPKDFSTLKKSAEVKAANNGEIIFRGQLKMVDGLAIVTSINVPVGTLYIADKKAVVALVKTEPTVKIDTYNEKEYQTFVVTFCNLVYLADEKHAIKMTKKA